MKTRNLLFVASSVMLLLAAPTFAQQFEAVHAINYESSSQGKKALDSLMQDEAMKGAHVTLYAKEFGGPGPSHLVVEDFDGYSDYMDLREKRQSSHGWSKYMLQAADAEYMGSGLVMVVDDHGAARRTAGYLVAYLIKTSDAAAYRSGIADLNDAVGNPGVLRLVANRADTMDHTHAVLIGGSDFAAVNKYLDKLFASDAFAEFVKKVGDTREVVGVDMYRRVAVWGD